MNRKILSVPWKSGQLRVFARLDRVDRATPNLVDEGTHVWQGVNKMSTCLRLFPYRLLICLAMAICAPAQQDSGGLVINVRDPNGAVVPGAKVTVTNVDTNQKFPG